MRRSGNRYEHEGLREGGSEKRQRPLCPNPLDETEVAEAPSLLIGPRQLEDQKCCKECENVRSAPQRQLLFL
jgi:hypothetical protein